MKLALIPPGEFLMGSPSDEKGHKADETQHRVRISSHFTLASTQSPRRISLG